MTEQQLQVGDLVPDVTLLDEEGYEIALADLWQRGPIVLTLLRHFGCVFCRAWLKALQQHMDAFEDAGIQVVGIGIGVPKHAERVCGKKAPSVMCLSDATIGTHVAFGLGHASLGQLLDPRMMVAGAKAVLAGNMQGIPTGDTRMMPGTFIVDREGIIQYAFYSDHPGAHPPIADLVEVGASL